MRIFPESVPTSFIPDTPLETLLDFRAIHLTELARQLTLHEFALTKAIQPRELVGLAWTKRNKEELAPNVTALISNVATVCEPLLAHFALSDQTKKTSKWFSDVILAGEGPEERGQLIERMIQLMEELQKLNNFSSIMQILSALNFASIYRLKESWAVCFFTIFILSIQIKLTLLSLNDQIISEESEQSLERIRAIMSPDRSYYHLRQQMRVLNPPCVPYIGLYLTDLTFIEESGPDSRGIKLRKFKLILDTISDFRTYCYTDYNLAPVPAIQDYIKHFAG